ncbi:hypothetical protein FNV43_RR00496 [Rhamnella rubrinervis]|uniref:Secreted protein n=1 Tax=Rhamnella rubrinervis TaxID=2594499 RepID=A0A8K0MRZ8_9ROSA|nr:hypothetical protein FNV43_RR00496 [Rhamnella rubrinervis]
MQHGCGLVCSWLFFTLSYQLKSSTRSAAGSRDLQVFPSLCGARDLVCSHWCSRSGFFRWIEKSMVIAAIFTSSVGGQDCSWSLRVAESSSCLRRSRSLGSNLRVCVGVVYSPVVASASSSLSGRWLRVSWFVASGLTTRAATGSGCISTDTYCGVRTYVIFPGAVSGPRSCLYSNASSCSTPCELVPGSIGLEDSGLTSHQRTGFPQADFHTWRSLCFSSSFRESSSPLRRRWVLLAGSELRSVCLAIVLGACTGTITVSMAQA